MNNLVETIKLIEKYTDNSFKVNNKLKLFYSEQSYIECTKIIRAYHNYILKSKMIDINNIDMQIICINIKGEKIDSTLDIESDRRIYKLVVELNEARKDFDVPSTFINISISKNLNIRFETSTTWTETDGVISFKGINNIRLPENCLLGIALAITESRKIVIEKELLIYILKYIAIINGASTYEQFYKYFINLCKYYIINYTKDDDKFIIVNEIQKTFGKAGVVQFMNWFTTDRPVITFKNFIHNRQKTTGVKIINNIIYNYNTEEIYDISYNLCMIAILELIGIWEK